MDSQVCWQMRLTIIIIILCGVVRETKSSNLLTPNEIRDTTNEVVVVGTSRIVKEWTPWCFISETVCQREVTLTYSENLRLDDTILSSRHGMIISNSTEELYANLEQRNLSLELATGGSQLYSLLDLFAVYTLQSWHFWIRNEGEGYVTLIQLIGIKQPCTNFSLDLQNEICTGVAYRVTNVSTSWLPLVTMVRRHEGHCNFWDCDERTWYEPVSRGITVSEIEIVRNTLNGAMENYLEKQVNLTSLLLHP